MGDDVLFSFLTEPLLMSYILITVLDHVSPFGLDLNSTDPSYYFP